MTDYSAVHVSTIHAPAEVTVVSAKYGISSGLAVNYIFVYEKSETGWAAYVPDLPGVVTTGRTREDVRSLIQEAIEFHLDGLREDRLPIPPPSAEAELISIRER